MGASKRAKRNEDAATLCRRNIDGGPSVIRDSDCRPRRYCLQGPVRTSFQPLDVFTPIGFIDLLLSSPLYVLVMFAGARWIFGYELNDVAKSAVNAFMSTGLGGYAWDIISALIRMIIIGILAVQSLRHEWEHTTNRSCPYPPEDVKAGYTVFMAVYTVRAVLITASVPIALCTRLYCPSEYCPTGSSAPPVFPDDRT